MTSRVVSARLDALAAGHPAICTRSLPADWRPGRAGATSGYVRIADAAAAPGAERWAVLLSGGVHARELAPPDALISFCDKLLTAYATSSPITYPAWTDPVSGIVYDAFVIPWPWVQAVVSRLDLYVAPLVNPDGRDFVLTPLGPTASRKEHALHKGWRKNRRPAPAGNTDPMAVGVDLNRNFDIEWDFTKAYDVTIAGVGSSTRPESEIYIGPAADGPESEPETKNLADLMRLKDISYFIDFHAFGRDVLYSWGIETNQSDDAAMSFLNAGFDGRRDGVVNSAYREYIPNAMAQAVSAMAQRMSGLVLSKAGGADPRARARSGYTAKQSADLYVTSGASDDYCFSRWFTAPAHGGPIRPVMAFTVEVGGDPDDGPDGDDGGFTPDYVTQFPKLEREIHVAAFAFLSAVAAGKPGAPRPPAPPEPPGGP